MSRFARSHRVYFFEEPVYEEGDAHLGVNVCAQSGVQILTPVLPPDTEYSQVLAQQRQFLQQFLLDQKLEEYIAWYYTPMAMEFTSVLDPTVTVYDCMDELTGFAGAAVSMKANEAALFQQADLVFTGGASLYASKRHQHPRVYPFPSSVDTAHFQKARSVTAEPADQTSIPRPRFGYAGVIDERMDLELIAEVARARQSWHFVLLGPIAKIEASAIPTFPNVHLLGMKQYAQLPEYLAGWDIGLLPFALNDATRFISPTKTPEYLAAGLRVMSTPIRDVVTPYGDLNLVSIASTAGEFIAAAEQILANPSPSGFAERVQQFLARSSWDKTYAGMEQLMENSYQQKHSDATGQDLLSSAPAAITKGGN